MLIGIEAASGASGDDRLIGDDPAIEFAGARGSDLLTGGAGADVFVWATAADSGLGVAADLIDLTGFGELTDLAIILQFGTAISANDLLLQARLRRAAACKARSDPA